MRAGLSVVSLLIVLLLVSPVLTEVDDFPVSTQPMFATPQEQFVTFVTARAITDEGGEVELTMEQIASTDDPLVAEEFMSDARRDGRLGEVCRSIASRVPSRADEIDTVEQIEIVELTYDLDLVEPVNVVVLASCGVP